MSQPRPAAALRRRVVGFRWPAAAAIAACVGLVLVSRYGDVEHGDTTERAIGWLGTVAVMGLGLSAVRAAANRVFELLAPMVGSSHASLLRSLLTLLGAILAALAALGLLGVPVQQVLVGGAVTGIVLGIAAQQSLANMFAGVVLLVAQPFRIGDEVTIVSGALGGEQHGIVRAVGFTYVLLERDDGRQLRMPNAGVLASAVAVGPRLSPGPAAVETAE
jgi:small-conductance mechanosensitive channel